MGETAPDRNRAHYNGGVIHCSLSSDEVCLTFCDYYEVNLFRTQYSSRHPGDIVQFIKNPFTIYEENQGAIALAFSIDKVNRCFYKSEEIDYFI